jgi:tetratricopeptide (TPR) repeat protein
MTNSLIEFSQTISKLNKEKRYGEALKYFKDNKASFTDRQIAGNDYILSAMLTALRHTSNFDAAFAFINRYNITFSEATNEMVLNAVGWLLYFKFKTDNQQFDQWHNDDDRFDDEDEWDANGQIQLGKSENVEQIEKIIPLLLRFNNEFAYSIVSNLFNTVLKTEKRKPNPSWKLINDICDLISPAQLHTDCRTMEIERKGQKKPMELASDKENWFAFKSKALMKLGRFQECFQVSKLAIDTFETFHYSNDVWFARRIALSKMNLGRTSDAITELEQVLRRKKDWFIQKELAVLYLEVDKPDKAFSLAIAAINNFGDLEYKVDLLFLLGGLCLSPLIHWNKNGQSV